MLTVPASSGMDQATKAAKRKEYQRAWMAKKRRALKASRGVEEIKLTIPKALAADLRARKPFGLSLRQWLVVFLRDSLKGGEGDNRQQKTAQASVSGVARNAPCPCGSGKKFKVCCGKPV